MRGRYTPARLGVAPPDAVMVQPVRDVYDLPLRVWVAVEGVKPFMPPPPLPREDVARAAHELLRHHVGYFAEGDDQMIRTLLDDNVGDCKSTATFIASVCRAAGCHVALRFVQWHGEDGYGHVYTVVDGVPVDPLLDFGKESPYLSALTVPIP